MKIKIQKGIAASSMSAPANPFGFLAFVFR
jgi:hypothetical protein